MVLGPSVHGLKGNEFNELIETTDLDLFLKTFISLVN